MIKDEVLIVSVITIVGALLVFYWKLKKQILDEESSKNKPINDLNNSIIELNSTIKHMTADSETLKHRVEEHGKQIDEIKVDLGKLETKVSMYHKGS